MPHFALPSLPAFADVRRRTVLGAALAVLASPAWAAKKAGKKASAPVRPLRPGQALWLPQLSPAGPVVAAVNLHTQHMQIYRNGVAIAFSSISSGRQGYRTPTGLFHVLQKHKDHRSNKYNDAPMPWMVRITWDGVAFHAGSLPGYPASHGCIRLPHGFAPNLYKAIRYYDNVLVVNQAITAGQQALTMLAPIDPQGNPMVSNEMLQDAPWWAPEPQPEPAPAADDAPLGVALAASAASAPEPAASDAAPPAEPAPEPQPLALLASLPQRRLFVLREGSVLATAPLQEGAASTMSARAAASKGKKGKGRQQQRQMLFWDEKEMLWNTAPGMAIGEAIAFDDVLWRDVLPTGEFAARVRELLTPGSSLLFTDMHAVGDIHAAAWGQPDRRPPPLNAAK